MKEEKGITLVSLIVYVGVMIIVLSVMSSVITNFYNNTESLNTSVEEIIQFNKFNTYFLKEIKSYNNKVDTIKSEGDSHYILFTSGNSFVFNSNKIYYNNVEICDNVKSINFEKGKNKDENGNETEDETIVSVTLSFDNFSKSINYKVENIY